MVNFPIWIPDPTMCSAVAVPSIQSSDHIVVLVSTDFPSNSEEDGPFYHKVYDYSLADLDGIGNHLRDVLREDIFKCDL